MERRNPKATVKLHTSWHISLLRVKSGAFLRHLRVKVTWETNVGFNMNYSRLGRSSGDDARL